MDVVEWAERPELRNPVGLVAFEGWNDAADAASGAVEFILDQFEDIEPFAVILPEEFFNFQMRRPDVEIGDGGARDITWPVVAFYAIPLPDQHRDLVIVLGEEPHHRWLTFAGHVIEVLESVGVKEVITLGAFIGQVAHTLPVPIIGVATDPTIVERHQLLTSDYEGPTGISGVLNLSCAEAGMDAVKLEGGAEIVETVRALTANGIAVMAHLGLTRRQVIALVGAEAAAWLAAGTLIGLGLGLAMAVVLVHVVNPQSFHWTMPLQIPVPRLAALAGAVLAAGVATALWSARRAAGRSAVMAVKEDW